MATGIGLIYISICEFHSWFSILRTSLFLRYASFRALVRWGRNGEQLNLVPITRQIDFLLLQATVEEFWLQRPLTKSWTRLDSMYDRLGFQLESLEL